MYVTLTVVFSIAYWVRLEQSFTRAYESEIQEGKLRAGQLTEVVRQAFALSFRNADFVLLDVRSALKQPAGGSFLAATARALALLPPSAYGRITLYDREGTTIATSSGPVLPVSAAGADFFRALADAPPDTDPVVLGRISVSPSSGQWELPIARRVTDNGAFAGVLVLSLSPMYFSDELARIHLGPNDVVGAVQLPDGNYLARNQGMPGLLSHGVRSNRPYLVPDAPAEGVFIDEGSAEPVLRIIAWSRVPDLPVVAFVGLSEEDLVAQTRSSIARERLTNAAGTTIILTLLFTALYLMVRLERQKERLRRQKMLYTALFNQNKSVKLLTHPDTGQIVDANQAACDFYGYTRDELLSRHIFDINCLPHDEIMARMAEARALLRPYFLFPHRLASGEIRQVEVYSGPIEVGGELLLYSIVHDVTDRFALQQQLEESEARHRALFEVVPSGMIVMDGEGTIVRWNQAALAVLATDEAGLVQRTKALFTPEDVPVCIGDRPSMRALGRDLDAEILYTLDEAGTQRWLTISSRRLPPHADGRPAGAVVSFADITRVVELEEAARIGKLVFDFTAEGIMVTNALGVVSRINAAYTSITGFELRDIVGRRAEIFLADPDSNPLYRGMHESLAVRHSWEGEIQAHRKDGRSIVERMVVSPVFDPHGTTIGYVALISDISERHEREDLLWHRANFDSLTGLPNRTLLNDRITQALVQATRRNGHAAVLFIDLDRFKPVNDTHGHAVGDELLRQVAQRIRACVRDEDTVARLGGDEFVVLLPSVHTPQATTVVAEKILARLKAPFRLSTTSVTVSACIGISIGNMFDSNVESLVARADAAMYRAKAEGRDRYVISDAPEYPVPACTAEETAAGAEPPGDPADRSAGG
ncbi:diguanylate cyclase [Pseudoxanthobacter sp.]|uniref:sensor domain-containing diguanylate cyclase n=1 Tax=Pseudoxanthobacter sp. TaxID=1925742 RepID=UPI002FE1CC57